MESRTPPQNLDAEQSVLGSILLDNEVYASLEGILRPEHFYKESHRKLFKAIERLHASGEPIDLVTLTEELRRSSELDEVGNVPYLIGLADSVPTAAYAESYARIVVEKAVLRELIGASGQIMQRAYDGSMPLEDVLDAAEKSIFELSSSKRAHRFGSMSELVTETFAHINELFSNPDPVSGLRTGFKELDQMTAGLQASSLNVLAARPSMGKCVTAGTLIDLPGSGERITIEEFVRRRHGCVYGIDERGRVRPTRVSAWIDSGVKPAFRVTTRTGRRVETTGHHPFLAVGGWTPLHDLTVGDAIAVPRGVPAFGRDDTLSPGRVRLLAYLVAGAGLTHGAPGVSNLGPVLVSDLRDVLAAEFPRVELHGDGSEVRPSRPGRPGNRQDRPNPLAGWLRELGLTGTSAQEMRVPAIAWSWDRSRLATFLRVLFSCAGTIEPFGAGRRARIELAVASRELADDVHHALVRFGIVARSWRETPSSWRLEITEAASVARYGTEIGWIGANAGRRSPTGVAPERRSDGDTASAAAWELVKDARHDRGSTLSERAGRGLPPGRLAAGATALAAETSAPAASPELYWDEIASIEPLGPRQVYDLTVPAGANFVANDVCVHNTALALSIALNAALREKKTVGLFSLEMSGVQLVTRMLCSEARVDMSRVRNGQLTDRDFQRLADTAGRMSEARIFIDDNADMTVMELRSRARRLMAEHELGLIVIDYLQLMSGTNVGRFGSENRQQEISSISRGLKALARELDIPVLVLSQLSRAVESRPNKRPMLSDLRECVPGDTLVVLADGRRLPIRDLVDQTPCVTAVDERGRLVPARAEKVWPVGRRPLTEVVTASGRRLRATEKHRVLAAGGWTLVRDLAPGSRVALSRRLPKPTSPVTWSDDEVELLGQLIGGGSYPTGRSPRYTGASPENLAAVRRAAGALGSTVRELPGRRGLTRLCIGGDGTRGRAAGVGAWLEAIGIFGQRSHQKRIPVAAFRLADDQVARLLSHLWASRGRIRTHAKGGRGSHEVAYATNGRGLADDVAGLLLRLGIVARIVEGADGTQRSRYAVHVSGAEDQLRFLQAVPAFGPCVPQARRLLAALTGVRTDPDRETVRDRTRPRADPRHRDACHDDLYWDEVVSVRPAGEEEVFDLTVPGPASWLADGLVCHNSGAIEQDADLVMFIYRDEYYDPNSEKQGIAEIIIGKQRNGPVGALDLQFHNAHVRFNDLARGTP